MIPGINHAEMPGMKLLTTTKAVVAEMKPPIILPRCNFNQAFLNLSGL